MNRKGQITLSIGFIIALAIAIPLFIGGFAMVWKLIRLMNMPVIAGYVPVWVIALAVLLLLMISRRR